MAVSDICPTEDAVQALLEYLVDPMLPAKSCLGHTPMESQLQSVAKQVHSVVLLYNYYHRKQHPNLEYLAFDAFCQLVVILRPCLVVHMKSTRNSGDTKLHDVKTQLSLTEKQVMNACDICMSLDTYKDVPNIEGCPISKVSVLLVDYKKENCLLLFSSITQGVWSLIEKNLDNSNQNTELALQPRDALKKKRVIRKHSKDEVNAEEAIFLHAGYSAVKEAADIDEADLKILESHVVYSQSREKEAAQFYIMQSTHFSNEKLIQVPIKDIIDSLQGPLLRKCSSGWTTTPVVEHFHVLPYADVVKRWLSRESFSSGLLSTCLIENSIPMQSPDKTRLPENDDTVKAFSDVSRELRCMDENDAMNVPGTSQDNLDKETKIPCLRRDSNGSPSALKVQHAEPTRLWMTECEHVKVASGGNTSPDHDHTLTTYCYGSDNIGMLHHVFASKEKILSQTALRAVVRKRNKLSLQLRVIEDEIALCDKNIQMISNGGEDALALKIESVIEGCNDVCEETPESSCQYYEGQCSSQYKRKRSSEAILHIQDSCEELDGVCHMNNWILPTYHVFLREGGFQATVNVKGGDFECSCEGLPCSLPLKARESAATVMLAKLKSMTN